MDDPSLKPHGQTLKAEPHSYRIFPKANWAGFERIRVEITYTSGSTRLLKPEFKDEDAALRYMDRFYSDLSRQT